MCFPPSNRNIKETKHKIYMHTRIHFSTTTNFFFIRTRQHIITRVQYTYALVAMLVNFRS